MSRWVIAAGLKLISFRLTPLGCGVASPADRELGLPTPAEPERVAPASASRSGPVSRVEHQNGAGNSAVSVWHHPGLQRAPMWLFPLGLPRVAAAASNASRVLPRG